jgi:hypothetical protein
MCCVPFVAALGVLLVVGSWATAQLGKPTALKDVPEVVKDAAGKAAPKAKWDLVVKFSEGYKLFGKDARDRHAQVRVTTAGKVLDVSLAVPLGEVPEPVSAALKKEIPEFKPSAARTVGPDSMRVLYYQFSGKTADGKNKEVHVTPDGKKVRPVK